MKKSKGMTRLRTISQYIHACDGVLQIVVSASLPSFC